MTGGTSTDISNAFPPTTVRLNMLAQGYHPVPVLKHDARDKAAGKRPLMDDWQTICATADKAEICRWEKQRSCLNTGVLCGEVVGLDIDVPDPALSQKVLALADALLPPTPLQRIGKAPKSLLVFRAEGIHRKVSTPALFLPDGTKLQVEALGTGNHFVAYGTHPETKKPYAWPHQSPLDVAFADLPVLPDATLRSFLMAAEAVMRAAGGRTEAEIKDGPKPPPQPAKPKPRASSNTSFPATTRDDVQDALRAIPNRHDWAGWVRIGGAIFAALADDGEDLFLDWSAQSAKDDPKASRAKWKSFRRSEMTVGEATLFYEARRNGWKPARELEREQRQAHEEAADGPYKPNGSAPPPQPTSREPESPPEQPSTRDMLEHPDMSVLRLHRRPPPALDLEVFGPRWAEWIATTAAASACSPDYVAAPLLAISSVLIGNACWAEAWPGWAEPPHLWACCVGDSGSGKSPGSDLLLRDVVPTLERRMSVDHPDKLLSWKTASETDKAARELWEGEVRTAYKERKTPPLPPEPAAQQKPEIPRLRQNDVTVEKVATLLATAAPKGVMIHRDEMLGWIAGMDAYHDGGRAFWIEGYGGRPYRVERQKHPEPIDIPRLAVAAFGGTQPAKVAGLLRDADDGLLGRIGWFWPDPVPFAKGTRPPGIPWAIEALDLLRRLDLSPATPDTPACPVLVPLHETLHTDLVKFSREMQTRQQEAGGLMQSAFGKARGLVLRLSLVLTYLRWVGERPNAPPPAQITPAGFEAAARLVAGYLMPMAERVYGDAATNKDDRDAATLARWIIKTKPHEVHVRTMQRKIKLPELGNAESIYAALAVLVEAGWLVPPKIGFGTARKVSYVVNQRVFEADVP